MVEDIAESMNLGLRPFDDIKVSNKPEVIERWREDAESL
jgi:hypothetical protein